MELKKTNNSILGNFQRIIDMFPHRSYVCLILIFASLLLSCKKGNNENKVEKLYSPIWLYFNPLKAYSYDQYSSYLPYFVNYPDDWAKMGLHNRPIAIKYSDIDGWTNRSFYICYRFNMSGNLYEIENSALGRDEFIYDDYNRLTGITRMRNLLGDGKKNQFEYSDSLLIRRKVSPSPSTAHLFSYYPSGVLKEIIPERGIYDNERQQLGKLEFNEEGQLVRTESARTFNPFLEGPGGYNADTRNVCTFKYDERGLCIEKKETIAYKASSNPTDTLVCISKYAYNSNGDLTDWNYNGGTYYAINGNQWRITDRNFSIKFDYTYDDKGNWLTQTMTLPDCYQEVYSLLEFYEKNVTGYFVSNRAPSKLPAGQKPVVKFSREIPDYYTSAAETSTSQKGQAGNDQKEELEKQKAMVKYSAAQSLGLSGKVKSLDTDEKTYIFNELGNIEKIIDKTEKTETEYTYDNPLKYKLCGECGPRYIVFTGNKRRETDKQYEELDEVTTFDSKGRVTEYVYYEGMAPVTVKFKYTGNDMNPVEKSVFWFDEIGQGTTTYHYTYLGADKEGNWTKRRVKPTYESEEFDESDHNSSETAHSTSEGDSFIETRKITYY